MYTVWFQLCTMYTALFYLCTIDTTLCTSLQLFHYIYCEAISMSSCMIITHLACMCRGEVVQFSSVFSLHFFTMDSAGNNTLSHCCFQFLLHYLLLPHTSFHPHFLSTSFHVSAIQISMVTTFISINLWSPESSPSGQ